MLACYPSPNRVTKLKILKGNPEEEGKEIAGTLKSLKIVWGTLKKFEYSTGQLTHRLEHRFSMQWWVISSKVTYLALPNCTQEVKTTLGSVII